MVEVSNVNSGCWSMSGNTLRRKQRGIHEGCHARTSIRYQSQQHVFATRSKALAALRGHQIGAYVVVACSTSDVFFISGKTSFSLRYRKASIRRTRHSTVLSF